LGLGANGRPEIPDIRWREFRDDTFPLVIPASEPGSQAFRNRPGLVANGRPEIPDICWREFRDDTFPLVIPALSRDLRFWGEDSA
jgi:hypothetical protein